MLKPPSLGHFCDSSPSKATSCFSASDLTSGEASWPQVRAAGFESKKTLAQPPCPGEGGAAVQRGAAQPRETRGGNPPHSPRSASGSCVHTALIVRIVWEISELPQVFLQSPTQAGFMPDCSPTEHVCSVRAINALLWERSCNGVNSGPVAAPGKGQMPASL